MLLALLLAAWAALLQKAECDGWKDFCEIPSEFDMVVCCDSQTETSLSPECLPRLFNASRSGTRICQWYLRTKDICERSKGRIKWGIIDVPAIKLWREKPDSAPNFGMAKSLAPLHFLHLRENTVPLYSLAGDFCREIWRGKSRQLLRHILLGESYTDSIRGGFAIYADRGFIEHADYVRQRMDVQAEKVIEAECLQRDSGDPPFVALRWIDAIVGLYREAGAKVVLIQTPVHMHLTSQVADACAMADASIEKFAAERDVPIFNYRDMPFAVNEWKDGNHLNERGARRLTLRLKADIDRLEGVAGAARRIM